MLRLWPVLFDRPAAPLTMAMAVAVAAGLGAWLGGCITARSLRSAAGQARPDNLPEDHKMLRAVLDHAPMALFLKNPAGRYLLANRHVGQIAHDLGDGPRDNAVNPVGATDADLFPAEIAKWFHRQEQEMLARGQPVSQEIDVTGQDGTQRSFLVTSFPVFDDDGTCIAVGGIRAEITESNETERMLRRAKEEAELANRAKTEFLANMSHELRTPLNSIIGFSDLLVGQALGDTVSPQYREYAGDINAAGKHLLQLINDILDLARIERGRMTMNERRLDVGLMLNACLRLVRERGLEAGVGLNLSCPAEFPALLADELRVKQAVVNLLSNAVKFSERGGVVELAAELNETNGIVIRITDDGIGIAPEDLQTALSEFGQVDGSLTRTHQGTGLGLSLARKLVEFHGGRLELESTPTVGTTARLVFPANRTLRRPVSG